MCPSKLLMCLPSATLWTFTKRSVAPEARNAPSRENSSAVTASECGAANSRTSAPSAPFQSLISPERLARPLPVARIFPSGEKASAMTPSIGGTPASSSLAGGVSSPPIVRASVQRGATCQIPAAAAPPPMRARPLSRNATSAFDSPAPPSHVSRGIASWTPWSETMPSAPAQRIQWPSGEKATAAAGFSEAVFWSASARRAASDAAASASDFVASSFRLGRSSFERVTWAWANSTARLALVAAVSAPLRASSAAVEAFFISSIFFVASSAFALARSICWAA